MVGATEAHRQTMREVLGDVAENLVYGYSKLPWRQPGAIPEHLRLGRGSRKVEGDIERSLVWMRLANELEEYLDFGNRYAPNSDSRAQSRRIYGPHMLELARLVGAEELGAELESAFFADETMEASRLAPGNPSELPPTAIVRRCTQSVKQSGLNYWTSLNSMPLNDRKRSPSTDAVSRSRGSA